MTPANGTVNLGTTVTLEWSPVTDAGYSVCWDTTNNNTCDGGWWPNGASSARTLTDLAPGTYYWQVRAHTASGAFDGNGGTWWSFTVR
jgi:plastocyanin